MSKALKALERIKNAPTIYVGLASDIYTRYPFECKEIENALKELEQYKETEQELGIDLITLFKLIKSKKIYSFSNNGIANNDINGINIYTNTITIWNGVCKVEYPLSEYGKSFALTKEELL